jgi:hypothetical protein
MTHAILVDPKLEIILHNINIIDKNSVKRFKEYHSQEERARGYPLERVLIREGFVTVLEIKDEIPIPVNLGMARGKF